MITDEEWEAGGTLRRRILLNRVAEVLKVTGRPMTALELLDALRANTDAHDVVRELEDAAKNDPTTRRFASSVSPVRLLNNILRKASNGDPDYIERRWINDLFYEPVDYYRVK